MGAHMETNTIKSLEAELLRCLTGMDFLGALSRWSEMAGAGADPCRVRFLRAHIQACLSPANYVESYLVFLELTADRDTPLEVAMYACVEGSRLAVRLHDWGRMRRIESAVTRLRRRYGTPPEIARWLGPILLNQATLAAEFGDPRAIGIYRSAIRALRRYEQFWCYRIGAYARLAALLETDGRSREADAAVRAAEALVRGDVNRQEVLLAKARLAYARGHAANALPLAVAAAELAPAARDWPVVGEALRLQSLCLQALGCWAEVAACRKKTRTVALEHRLYPLLQRLALDSDSISERRNGNAAG